MEGLGNLDGKVLGGRYRLQKKLGQGGMGAVYTGVQTSLGREVAIKVLLPVLSTDPRLIARFKGEAEQAGRLNHPNIVQVLDFGREEDGSVWLAMELLEGEPLAARIERGPLSEDAVVRMAKGTLAGLAAAHAVPLVHRDLKPDNIFIQKTAGVGEVVKILDFGIAKLLDGDGAAKLTATGLIIGTPLYMSPEQARGEDDLDGRSDLYSLGAVMYEALTGQPPYTGANYNALLVAVLTGTPRPVHELRPDLTPALGEVVMRALAKDKSERFPNADEMIAALSTFTPKTDAPPSREALGLASTVATPQAGVNAPAAREVPQTASTPVAGGVGPAATEEAVQPSPATSNASAEPAAPTPASEPASETRPTRNFGWLMPAMILTGLVVGIGGTYAIMSGGHEGDPVTTTPVAVVPVGGAALGSGDGSGSGNGDRNGDGSGDGDADGSDLGNENGDGSGDGDANGSDNVNGDVDSAGSGAGGGRHEDGSGRNRPRMRRTPRVHLTAYLSYNGGHRDWREGNLQDHYAWDRCWPRGMQFPENNWGLGIQSDTTADGELVGNFEVAGRDNYPELRQCLQEHLPGVNVGPSESGSGSHVTISFSFDIVEPRGTRMRH